MLLFAAACEVFKHCLSCLLDDWLLHEFILLSVRLLMWLLSCGRVIASWVGHLDWVKSRLVYSHQCLWHSSSTSYARAHNWRLCYFTPASIPLLEEDLLVGLLRKRLLWWDQLLYCVLLYRYLIDYFLQWNLLRYYESITPFFIIQDLLFLSLFWDDCGTGWLLVPIVVVLYLAALCLEVLLGYLLILLLGVALWHGWLRALLLMGVLLVRTTVYAFVQTLLLDIWVFSAIFSYTAHLSAVLLRQQLFLLLLNVCILEYVFLDIFFAEVLGRANRCWYRLLQMLLLQLHNLPRWPHVRVTRVAIHRVKVGNQSWSVVLNFLLITFIIILNRRIHFPIGARWNVGGLGAPLLWVNARNVGSIDLNFQI